MSTRIPLPPPGFDDLSADEKMDYVQSLWDRIADGGTQVPVPDWHREIIRRRLLDRKADPDDVIEWTDFRNEIRRDLDQRKGDR